MEQITNLINQLQALPLGDLVAALLIILGFFSAVSAMTPWTWDNKIVNFIQKIVDFFGLAGKQPK